MEDTNTAIRQVIQKFPATIIQIVDEYKVAINRGSEHGIQVGQRFLLYRLSETDIKDPETGESLGYLEIVKGTGKVTHVQPKMSTIQSDRVSAAERRIIRRKSPLTFMMPTEEEEIVPSGELLPFDDPQVGDKAKPV
jgi:hypothetical protein